MSSTTVVVAPSVFAPPMFSPFGGFGYGYGGGFMPVSIFGSLFQVRCRERERESEGKMLVAIIVLWWKLKTCRFIFCRGPVPS